MTGKLDQPGCHANTGGRSGRRLVRLENVPPENNHSMPIADESSSSIPLIIPVFQNATEGVDAALRKFKSLRSTRPLRSEQVLVIIKHSYPHLIVNKGPLEGHVPGVEVGRCFESRAELCLVGLHRLPRAGIDWKEVSTEDGNKTTIAISIVVSGGYEDDVDEGHTLTYTGQGGQDENRQQCADQKMEGGNMALCESSVLQNSVRVIRGRPQPQPANSSAMLYSYDGLYKVQSWREDVGLSGFKVYKFTLVREEGQAPL